MSTQLLIGHVLEKLAEIPSNSVHMVWTSIPYWGLRDYGTEPQVWGGDIACGHEWGSIERGKRKDMLPADQSASVGRIGVADPATGEDRQAGSALNGGAFCRLCGAWRGEHGLEPTLALWLEHEVRIFREVRRVLRPDGTLWLNVGDAYSGAPNGRSAADQKAAGTDDRTFRDKPVSTVGTLAAKQRLMLPARLALALQDDGWWLRDEIVWSKANPMPSSVKDRTTPAHEMLYMLSKRPRYFYDDEAIKEPTAESSIERYSQPTVNEQRGGSKADAFEASFPGQRSRSRRPNEIIQSLAKQKPAGWDKREGVAHSTLAHNGGERAEPSRGDNTWATRRKRSVWHLALEPFAGAHFATAPTALVRPCVLAGTSARGVCPSCGAPWVRLIAKSFVPQADAPNSAKRTAEQLDPSSNWDGVERGVVDTQTLGWEPSCDCDAGKPIPATVLDPFGGSGTTALVAEELGRDAILIELNPTSARIARDRIREHLGRVQSDIPEDRGADLPLIAWSEACRR